MKKFLGIAVVAMLGVMGYVSSSNQSQANEASNLMMENVEALSYGSEFVFTDVCFLNYLEENSVFEHSLIVRKCVPCGELVWIKYADNPAKC